MSKEYKFKSSGKLYKQAVQEALFFKKIKKEKIPIGIKTPLESGVLNNENLFKMNFKVEDQIEDNFKNLLLTRKGEKLGSSFGTNLREIFSLKNKENIKEIAIEEIRNAVELYLPDIILINSEISEKNNGKDLEILYKLVINYRISGIDNTKSITIELETSG